MAPSFITQRTPPTTAEMSLSAIAFDGDEIRRETSDCLRPDIYLPRLAGP